MAIVNGQTYYRFDQSEDVVSDRQDISAGLWSGGAGTLLTIYTSSTQAIASGQYYLDVYNYPQGTTTNTPEVQFSVAYGHIAGSGSSILNAQYPSKAIYTQYRNVLLPPTDDYFTINSVNKNHILVINFKLDRIKQTIDPGNWQFTLSGSSAGSLVTMIDDSGQTTTATTGKAGRVFNVVSGTIAGGVASGGATFGLIYPDAGIIVLDPDTVNSSANVVANVSSSNVASVNMWNFIVAMSGSMVSNNGFIARNVENVASTHYFVRAKSAAFNFSNNPTFVTGTLGDLNNQDMIKNPTVYFTTIGMYNDNNELLAVAKLSQPLKKSFTNEALVRVKLDF